MAATIHWPTVRALRDFQRLRWLQTTIGNQAISAFRRNEALRDRLPKLEALYRPRVANTHAEALSAVALERCWQTILDEQAVTEFYTTSYRSLVRLAVLLVRDEPTAEEMVQECFIAMHDGWHRLREVEKALSYLKQAVVNRSKSVLWHRSVVDRNAPKPAPDMPSAEQGAMSLLERSAVITALRGLPDRQRQALVLRYYADMSEAQIAEMMGISKGAVKSHTARGMSSLRAVLEQTS